MHGIMVLKYPLKYYMDILNLDQYIHFFFKKKLLIHCNLLPAN